MCSKKLGLGAQETLDWLADRYGVTWSIQSGVLQVIKDGQGIENSGEGVLCQIRRIVCGQRTLRLR